jgi:hypothetical protein
VKATTSDKIGYIVAAVLCIAMAIFVLWPFFKKKKAKVPPPPSTKTAAPPAGGNQTVNGAGVNALAGMPVNGAPPPPPIAAAVPETKPVPAPSTSVKRTLDGDPVIII